MWLTANDALARLGSKPQSLYASVSRGRIRAKPDPADSRRSLYRAEDVERLAARARGRRSSAVVAAEAISWGEPVLTSAISTVSGGRLYYRGRDAADLARTATLEQAAALLWDAPSPAVESRTVGEPSMATAFGVLAERATGDAPSFGRGQALLRREAAEVLGTLADALLGQGEGPLHQRIAARFGRPGAAEDARRAMVLLADHELNASTFAARVAVSTGAPLAAGALAGLATLSGPLHGDAWAAVVGLAEEVGAADDATEALLDWLGEGRAVPGFGHRLYPAGDMRAAELLRHTRMPVRYKHLREAATTVVGEQPNIDFALAALAATHGLPNEAPLTIFALARCVGWLAHMLEQAASGQLIRPRARYVGPPVGAL